MKHIIYFFVILTILNGCNKFGKSFNKEKELAKILSTILAYEEDKILQNPNQKDSFYLDSTNMLYVIPGGSYAGTQWESQLSYALDSLNEKFTEFNFERKKYFELVDSLCTKLHLVFQIPKNDGLLTREVREGSIFAVVLIYNVWLNERKNRFFYLSSGNRRDTSNFQESAYDNITVFKKEKSKWVFEKEL